MVMPEFTTQLAAMIGLGVGIDYALFIVTRYRQGLHDGLDPEHAIELAIDTAGRAVLFAGATVVISLCGLFLMGVDFIRGLGVGRGRDGARRDARVGHARPGVARLHGSQHRPVPHPGAAPPREHDPAEHVVPLEPRRAAPAVDRRARGARGPARPRGPVPVVARRLLRHRQQPDERHDAARVRPALRGLRARLQRAADPRGANARWPAVARRAGDACCRRSGVSRRPARCIPNESGRAAIIRVIPTTAPQSEAHDASSSDASATRSSRMRRGAAARPSTSAASPPSGADVSETLVVATADLHRWRARAELPAAARGVPIGARAGQGRRDEPALDRRGVRRRRRRVPVGLARRPARHRGDGPDRAVRPDDAVRDRLRALDGLRGVPALADPRGVRPHRRQRARRSPTASRRPRASSPRRRRS